MSEAFDLAMATVRAGKGAEAERMMVAATREVAAEHGDGSAAHAASLSELSTILLAGGDFPRAAEHLRRCVAIRPPGRDAEKARLTYAMNLGEVLQRLGKLDEAEQVLRTSLEERGRFYGKKHAGYGYGLESLADLLRERGALEEARAAIDDAVEVFWDDGNPRVASALATRAPIAAAAGDAAFDLAPRLPDALYDELVAGVLSREGRDPPEIHLRVLAELDAVESARRGARSPLRRQVLGGIARIARAANAHLARSEALLELRALFEAERDARQALEATLALALTEDDAGDLEASRALYVEAVERAERLGDAEATSSALRNYGLFLVHKGNDDAGGRQAMEKAVQIAERSGAREMAGRARVALGINLQHAGDLARAQKILEAAVRDLPDTDADGLCAKSHLNAIVEGGSCGCGDMSAAVSQTLQAMVEREIPEGLLAKLEVRSGWNVDVHVAREMSPDEAETLERAIRHAVAALQKDLGKPR